MWITPFVVSAMYVFFVSWCVLIYHSRSCVILLGLQPRGATFPHTLLPTHYTGQTINCLHIVLFKYLRFTVGRPAI